jgi:hypothetical protein
MTQGIEMKTFSEYLMESKQLYDYRIKIVGDLGPDFMPSFKEKLKQFDVVSMSEVKKTPIQKSLPDFPAASNESMQFMDVSFNYPATPPQISQIAELLGLSPDRVCIQDRQYADSIDQERDRQSKLSKNLLTDTDFPAPDAQQKELKKDYSAAPDQHAVVKNAANTSFTVAGGKTPPAVTTNDFPMGVTSPMTSVRRPPRPATGRNP